MTKAFSANSFIAGLMLGVVLTGAWFFKGDLSAMPTPSSMLSSATTTPSAAEGGSVSVHDQPAGDAVTVESVTVPPPGVWVAVREVAGGDLGNVLGAARISGPRSAVSIPLLRATEPGHSYAIQLYRDDNNGAFDVSVNSVYVDFDTGARVVAYFSTTE
ncbi:MAG: hypothetical protein KGH56_01225 [Patescibacteria group bacterium]|nr:hypothetical protein [Patescibacteria group bacterium]